MTNFDRIKQMNIRELSILFGGISYSYYCHKRYINGDSIDDTLEGIKEWLESEVEEND